MKHAFSLVELSIVLVILGLLTGGILTGQNLIRAAELRSFTTEYSAYKTAINTFRDKYFALPGDMTNATNFWGSAGGSGTLGDGCEASAGTGTETCNGGGDGQLLLTPSAGEYAEIFTFWQHLANARLLEGSYTGIAGAADGREAFIGENVPQSKLGNAGWSARTMNDYAGDGAVFAYDYGNSFIFGGQRAGDSTFDPVFKPEELWNIDTKIDDGRPGSGNITAFWWDECTDAASNGSITASDRLDANYLLSETNVVCAVHGAKNY